MGRDLNPRPLRYEIVILVTQPQCLVLDLYLVASAHNHGGFRTPFLDDKG
jgi:hypothetical protein